MSKNTTSDNLNTAYDDAYHTLLNDCPQLIIPVVNEAFHENYDVNEKVERTGTIEGTSNGLPRNCRETR